MGRGGTFVHSGCGVRGSNRTSQRPVRHNSHEFKSFLFRLDPRPLDRHEAYEPGSNAETMARLPVGKFRCRCRVLGLTTIGHRGLIVSLVWLKTSSLLAHRWPGATPIPSTRNCRRAVLAVKGIACARAAKKTRAPLTAPVRSVKPRCASKEWTPLQRAPHCHTWGKLKSSAGIVLPRTRKPPSD